MIDRILLTVFTACLIACASLALGAIWFGETITGPLYFQLTGSLFIVGLASFLLWFTRALRVILKALPRPR